MAEIPVFIEQNWSLISDMAMAYLRACASDTDVADLITQWKALQTQLARVSPKVPETAKAWAMAIPVSIAKTKKLDVKWWARQLEEWSLMLQIQATRQAKKGG